MERHLGLPGRNHIELGAGSSRRESSRHPAVHVVKILRRSRNSRQRRLVDLFAETARTSLQSVISLAAISTGAARAGRIDPTSWGGTPAEAWTGSGVAQTAGLHAAARGLETRADGSKAQRDYNEAKGGFARMIGRLGDFWNRAGLDIAS
jgi:hypothetical protein